MNYGLSPSAPLSPLTGAERRAWRWFLAAVLLLGAAIYGQAGHFAFLNFDDPMFVSENPWLREGLRWPGLRWAFQANLIAHSQHAEYWAPLTLLSRLAEAQFFGMNAGAFHLVSAGLHLVNAVLLALALRQLTGYTGRALAVALLFLVQAQNVEPVCWLSARKDLLSATFYLTTLLAYGWYVRRQTRGRYGVVLVSYVACLTAKPMGVTLPFLLLILDGWPLARWRRAEEGRARLLAEKIPLLILAALGAGLAVVSQSDWSALADTGQLSLTLRVENALVSYVAYFRRIFWPDDLAAYYPHPGGAITGLRLTLALAAMAALTATAWTCRRRAPVVLAGWLWFGLLPGPVIGLVQIGSQGMADRYAYLAAVGPLTALVWLFAEHVPTPWRRAGLALALAIGTVFSAVQASGWSNSLTLFTRTIAITPPNAVAQVMLGNALFTSGLKRAAAARLRLATTIAPQMSAAWVNLAQVEITLGHDRAAIHCFAMDLQREPKNTRSMLLIGLLEKKLGEIPRAEAAFLRMKQTDPANIAAPLELGTLYAEQGEWRKAARAWNEYLVLCPGDLKIVHSRDDAARRASEAGT